MVLWRSLQARERDDPAPRGSRPPAMPATSRQPARLRGHA
jgi:hypothetical protein